MRPAAHCAACGARTFDRDLRDVSGDVAALLSVRDTDVVCRWCEARAERELDDSALDAILADAPEADRDAVIAGTLCDECGRHMADARAEICSCCAASWWTPSVYVPRADHEGPRPTLFDCAAAFAGTVAA